MKTFIFILLWVLSITSAEWLNDFEFAKQQARQNNKMILLNFSGSDWCAPCIKLKKDVFDKTAFDDFASQKLVLVRADFPRHKKNKLSDEQTAHNEKLAERYNPQGKFPLTLLLDSAGKVVKTWDGLPGAHRTISSMISKATCMENSAVTKAESRLTKKIVRLMGNQFTISVVSNDVLLAEQWIDNAVAEIQRIEKLLTTFADSSQTNEINREAGIRPVVVDQEVFDLIARSIRISVLTQGAFDITYGSIDKSLWNFDKNMTSLPDADTARRMVRLIDYRNIIMDRSRCSVMLKHKGMRIGFGGIGKGYAADCAKKILIDRGVQNGVVNASGDLTVWGTQADDKPWTIGIGDPNSKHPFSYLPLSNLSVATSGNYEKFVVINGKRYSHTIDPKTGLPAHGIKSVTVISPLAELSDAMATPITVMGVKAGLDMVNQMRGVECIIIDDNDRLYTSNNISIDKNRI